MIWTVPALAKQHKKEGLRQGKRKRKWKHIIDSAWQSHGSEIIESYLKGQGLQASGTDASRGRDELARSIPRSSSPTRTSYGEEDSSVSHGQRMEAVQETKSPAVVFDEACTPSPPVPRSGRRRGPQLGLAPDNSRTDHSTPAKKLYSSSIITQTIHSVSQSFQFGDFDMIFVDA